jgi:pyruvate, water dikinase
VNERLERRDLIDNLREREKELQCVYRVEEQLARDTRPLEEILQRVVEVIPPGWMYPDACVAQLTYGGRTYRSRDFQPTKWELESPIRVQGQEVGKLSVFYLEEFPLEAQGPFLQEEVRLIRSLTDRISHQILYRHLTSRGGAKTSLEIEDAADWPVALRMLRDTDRELYARLARRMLNNLVSRGIDEAARMLGRPTSLGQVAGNENLPERTVATDRSLLTSDAPFDLASRHLRDREILDLVQQWLREERAAAFNKVLADSSASLTQVAHALRRFIAVSDEAHPYSRSTENGLRATLIRRALSAQTEYIRVARRWLRPADFVEVFEHMIVPQDSLGTVGGKSAGLILALHVMRRSAEHHDDLAAVRVPRAWYLASDAMMAFITHNDLEEVIEQKYKEIDQVRTEYPNIVQLFKSSSFPAELVKGLSMVLDELGEGTPVIVRSSSLLEDRLGTAFSGKYKSLFVANQGSKRERLASLLDAIAEVYASVFGPDPIEYRRERGLLDFNEAMGVLLQEVVGRRCGPYFMPAFAGVAFSRNEFRWSPRIRREDGIVRLVPGLGTRAVDRVADDYPVLSVPGQPGLRANVAVDEILRYAPHYVDCIDLEQRHFTTITIDQLLHTCGTKFHGFELMFSQLADDRLRPASPLLTDADQDRLVCNFESLLTQTAFSKQIRAILDTLEQALGTPVDIEFAHDGKDLYLLQCRPQSSSEDERPVPIPQDLDPRDVLFHAHRYVSNGHVPDLTHVVYVDAEAYANLSSEREMREVGRAVGQLNELLPKHRFALIGPGRWGSRGDIRLGVPVTYSDINNTALLIEVARQRGNYVPDLSFGTHFFQDLVEANIRYLPLYPDSDQGGLQERFLKGAPNLLADLAADFRHLKDVVYVVDIPASTNGRILRVLFNADIDQGVGHFAPPRARDVTPSILRTSLPLPAANNSSDSWRWREFMARRIAARVDSERMGVVALYLFGSVVHATAAPNSDIDLIVHFRGTDQQRAELLSWLQGWSHSLAELNFLRTGYQSDGLLDVHIVTDEDIEKRTSYASKIGAVTDPAEELPLGTKAR